MIIDHLENLFLYKQLHPKFEQAFQFILSNDLYSLHLGKHEIDGEKLFIILDKSQGRKKEDSSPELHRKYIDIQIVLDGTDEMGWLPQSDCTNPSGEYNAEKDIQFFNNTSCLWMKVKKGMFVIFFPNDGHQPSIGKSLIHKAVIKVAV